MIFEGSSKWNTSHSKSNTVWFHLDSTYMRYLKYSREKAMAPHSSTLAWKIPWMEEPGGCSPWGHEESHTTEQLHFHFSLSCIGGGNGNPLQCSCLENPRNGGARGLPSMGSHRVGHDWSDLAAKYSLIEAENIKGGCQKLEDGGLRSCYSKGMKFHLCQIISWDVLYISAYS